MILCEVLTKFGLSRIISRNMPPLTPPHRPMNAAFWRVLLLLACMLVFSFALHAKLAVYGHSQPQSSTSSKLWTSEAKIGAPSMDTGWLLLSLLLVTLYLQLTRNSHGYTAEPVVVRESRRRRHLSRFLRPPPLN